jgi:glycosyltransferase involved in cell wall biosynthesis
MKKILFVTPFNIFPPYWGGGIRTYQLVKQLAKKYEVHLMFPSYKQFKEKNSEKYQNEFKKLGVNIYGIKPFVKLLKHPIIEHLNPFFFFSCLSIIFSKKIDIIICDYPWSGNYILGLYFLTKKPFIMIEHNVEYLVKKQTKARFVALMKTLEVLLCRYATKITAVSEYDKQKLTELGVNAKKIFVLENGFDKETFYPSKKYNERIRKKLGVEKKPLILFCGKLDYAPNKEAVYIIRWEILPRVLKKIPDAKFLIVGGGYGFDIKHDSLIFTGVVDKIEQYINVSDVVITPLLKGGGTRIKILEAIACSKTVISTKKGAEGLINKSTKPFLKIAYDWDTFSRYIVESLNHRDKRKNIPNEFIKKYSWDEIYKKIDKLIEC